MRVLIVLVVAGLSAAPAAAQGQQDFSKVEIITTRVSDNLVALEGQGGRPLLKGFEPVLRLQLLLEQRRGVYLEAQGRVTTDGLSPEAVAGQVVLLARTHGGW